MINLNFVSYNVYGSFRRVAPFVEHLMILSDKIILTQGVIYQKIKW